MLHLKKKIENFTKNIYDKFGQNCPGNSGEDDENVKRFQEHDDNWMATSKF